jgi:hypothetical protein
MSDPKKPCGYVYEITEAAWARVSQALAELYPAPLPPAPEKGAGEEEAT